MKRIAMTFVAFLQARTPAFLAVVMAAIGAQAQVNYMKITKTDNSTVLIPTGEVKDVSFTTKEIITVKGVSFTMIKVYGGTFQMGKSPDGQDVKPVHDVTLSDYFIAETEVTQELWQAVMGSNPSTFSGKKRPVETVSWNDSQEFIAKLNQLTGKYFRLPTEAEWEFAAKGGKQSRGYLYSGSDTYEDVSWCSANSNSQTHDVATKAPNELGLYDMSGNVWEFCQDWFGAYSSEAQTNPTGPSSGNQRVRRGGNWNYDVFNSRCVQRYSGSATSRSKYSGLRLAL